MWTVVRPNDPGYAACSNCGNTLVERFDLYDEANNLHVVAERCPPCGRVVIVDPDLIALAFPYEPAKPAP